MCKHGTDIEISVPVERDPRGKNGFKWKVKGVDACMAQLVSMLNRDGFYTKGCCCGHGKYPGSILFWDHKELKLTSKLKWRVWIEQINQTYIDVTGTGIEDATDRARRKWRNEDAIPIVTHIQLETPLEMLDEPDTYTKRIK